MHWVSVNESLPVTKKPESLFIVNTAKGVSVTKYSPVEGFNKSIDIDGTSYHGVEVTHWMQLPQPPAA
ncbi:DUF551 domain-containing protein [Pluralibacter gergoviae]|uniref:DUF551 domain-containing protein n=1 Tax=Pluralibacter gergoviae TaxID=61647 RepID=UPI003EE375DE